jgi:transposase-like protein
MKKSLQIEIDENSDYEEQNQKVQSELNDNLQKLEEKVQAVEADGDEEV